MNKHIFQVLGLTVALACLSGCTKNMKYQPHDLKGLNHVTTRVCETKKNVTVYVKKFSRQDCLHYFNQRSVGACPIQVSIDNQSESDWVLLEENIDIPLVDSRKIARNLHSGVWKSGLFALIPLWPITPVIGIVHGCYSHDANKKISEDIEEKTLQRSLIIPASQRRDVIIFTPRKSYTRNFSLSLVDAHQAGRWNHFHFGMQ